ncbi:MAG TPA: hypothetical protein PLU52_05740 [Opitutaceae bacterium]|nr:hypothetical protein [Opitutaceae bacterium]HND60678.1 hypothetical protein [Opitutaceae bacterium]
MSPFYHLLLQLICADLAFTAAGLLTSWYAVEHAVEGYEDEFGFHVLTDAMIASS